MPHGRHVRSLALPASHRELARAIEREAREYRDRITALEQHTGAGAATGDGEEQPDVTVQSLLSPAWRLLAAGTLRGDDAPGRRRVRAATGRTDAQLAAL